MKHDHGCRFAWLPQSWDTKQLTLSHNDAAHEDLDRSDTLERHLALTSGLVQTKLVTQLILTDGIGVVDLVSENQERNLGELLHGQEGVQFGLGLVETLMVNGIAEEYNSRNLGEIVLPQTAG